MHDNRTRKKLTRHNRCLRRDVHKPDYGCRDKHRDASEGDASPRRCRSAGRHDCGDGGLDHCRLKQVIDCGERYDDDRQSCRTAYHWSQQSVRGGGDGLQRHNERLDVSEHALNGVSDIIENCRDSPRLRERYHESQHRGGYPQDNVEHTPEHFNRDGQRCGQVCQHGGDRCQGGCKTSANVCR